MYNKISAIIFRNINNVIFQIKNLNIIHIAQNAEMLIDRIAGVCNFAVLLQTTE